MAEDGRLESEWLAFTKTPLYRLVITDFPGSQEAVKAVLFAGIVAGQERYAKLLSKIQAEYDLPVVE